MKQIEIVETHKSLADYKRHLNFLLKQVGDQRSLLNSTTDGNVFRRAQDNLAYWEEEVAIYTTARRIVEEDQDDFISLVSDLELGAIVEECYVCDGNGQIEHIKQSRFDSRYVDCEACFGTGKTNDNSCKNRNLEAQ